MVALCVDATSACTWPPFTRPRSYAVRTRTVCAESTNCFFTTAFFNINATSLHRRIACHLILRPNTFIARGRERQRSTLALVCSLVGTERARDGTNVVGAVPHRRHVYSRVQQSTRRQTGSPDWRVRSVFMRYSDNLSVRKADVEGWTPSGVPGCLTARLPPLTSSCQSVSIGRHVSKTCADPVTDRRTSANDRGCYSPRP